VVGSGSFSNRDKRQIDTTFPVELANSDFTAEAAWGADPLEYYGGFSSLKPDTAARFKSSLAPNGTVVWSTLEAKTVENSNSQAKTSVSANFTDVDWTFLQAVYGWSALQYQAWARGEIYVNAASERTVNLYTDAILEYAIDGIRHFGGDFYAFRKAPLVLHLSPGRHVIDLRLIRDVRAMGGIGPPTLDLNLELKAANDVVISDSKVLISDVVNDRIASPYGSVTVRNNGREWVEFFDISGSSMWVSLVSTRTCLTPS